MEKLGVIYTMDATHFLDEKGNIGPKNGPALKMATFIGAVVSNVTTPGPLDAVKCFKCGQPVRTGYEDRVICSLGRIAWQCTACPVGGYISQWQDTLWDITNDLDAH